MHKRNDPPRRVKSSRNIVLTSEQARALLDATENQPAYRDLHDAARMMLLAEFGPANWPAFGGLTSRSAFALCASPVPRPGSSRARSWTAKPLPFCRRGVIVQETQNSSWAAFPTTLWPALLGSSAALPRRSAFPHVAFTPCARLPGAD